jgi:hypothetical protein
MKGKRKVKEEFAENNTRGSLDCWEDMGRKVNNSARTM